MTEHRTATQKTVDRGLAEELAEKHERGRVPSDAILAALEGWPVGDAAALVAWAGSRADDPPKALKGWARKHRGAFSCSYRVEEDIAGIAGRVDSIYLSRRSDALYDEMWALEALRFAALEDTGHRLERALEIIGVLHAERAQRERHERNREAREKAYTDWRYGPPPPLLPEAAAAALECLRLQGEAELAAVLLRSAEEGPDYSSGRKPQRPGLEPETDPPEQTVQNTRI